MKDRFWLLVTLYEHSLHYLIAKVVSFVVRLITNNRLKKLRQPNKCRRPCQSSFLITLEEKTNPWKLNDWNSGILNLCQKPCSLWLQFYQISPSIQITKSDGIFLSMRYSYTSLTELCCASICKHETDECYDQIGRKITTNLVKTMTVTTKFVVTAVTMKLVVRAVMSRLGLTGVTTKLVVTANTTKLVVSAYFSESCRQNLYGSSCLLVSYMNKHPTKYYTRMPQL